MCQVCKSHKLFSKRGLYDHNKAKHPNESYFLVSDIFNDNLKSGMLTKY
jgi:hypothetical protein